MAIDWLMNLIIEKSNDKFTGSVKINMQFGKLSNINVLESLKPPHDAQ